MHQSNIPAPILPNGTALNAVTISCTQLNTQNIHKVYIYNALDILAVIGAIQASGATKSFRALFNLSTTGMIQGEILDNGNWIPNIYDALNHAQSLLDAEFATIFYNQNPGISLPTYLATSQNPVITYLTMGIIQTKFPNIYNFLHNMSDLQQFQF